MLRRRLPYLAALCPLSWLAVLLTLLLFHTGTAFAAAPGYPITLGEHTHQTCDALYLQQAYRPSNFRSSYFTVRPRDQRVRPTGAHGQCKYTLRDAQRTWLLKYRLGYSPAALRAKGRTFGGDLRNLLTGRVVRSQEQMKFWRNRHQLVLYPPKKCDLGDRIVQVALSKLGSSESWGSNWGPSVREFQAVTGAYHAAWCVSFAQWVYRTAGVGTFADQTAGVYYALGWAQRAPPNVATWSRTQTPHRGDLIVFHTWQGHMGIVDSATPGGFYSVEGNASNTVLRRFHPWGARNASFIHLKAADRRIVCPS